MANPLPYTHTVIQSFLSFSARLAISATWGDGLIGCPSVLFGEELARHLADSGRHTYAYRFMQMGPNFMGIPLPPWMGVTHGAELVYLFQPQLVQATPALAELSQRLLHAWANFAKTGRPTGLSPVWTEAISRAEPGHASARYLHLEAKKATMIGGHFRQVCETFWKFNI